MTWALFGAALLVGALVQRPLLARCGSGVFLHLLRLPGNLLHELAHAVAFLLTGYTVKGFAVSLFDAGGRGHVTPGAPWLPWTRPWVANLIAPVAPAFVGLAALSWAQLQVAPGAGAGGTALAASLLDVAWRDVVPWVVLVVAGPVSAEASPSEVDLKAWAVPATVVTCLLLAGWAAARAWAPELAEDALYGVRMLDMSLRAAAWRALALAIWTSVLWSVPAWIAGRLRG